MGLVFGNLFFGVSSENGMSVEVFSRLGNWSGSFGHFRLHSV